MKTKVVEGPTKIVRQAPPPAYTQKREVPPLRGVTVLDYIENGLQCRAVVEKHNEDKEAIRKWAEE